MQQAAEVKVGIFVVIVVALGVFVASSLKGGIGGAAQRYTFEIWFQAAPGVGKGSPVRLAGVDIGEVIEKDIVEVNEAVSFGVPSHRSVLPLEMVRSWSSGDGKDRAEVVVERRPVTVESSQRIKEFGRQRSVARLTVQVKKQYEMYTHYTYAIVGGVVFGDKQLEISDVGADGLPMPAGERGENIRSLREKDLRVAVLGASPANIDAIVSNVEQTFDEDTVARTKRIIENIDNMTLEAHTLVAAIRETVTANQGNADRMMTNLASASEDVQTLLAEARAQAGDTLQNLERMTATGDRVAANNEAKLNRIVSNAEATTESFARIARRNEGKVDETMSDVQGIARNVREMVASNRESIDHIADRLAGTADDIKEMTGGSKQQVADILDNLDSTTRRIDDLMAKSDARLAAIIEETHGMVIDARATVGSVRESIDPITSNLREASANVNTASRNVAALSADPSTKQILNNVERTTAEARELLADIRSITADPVVQDNLRETTANVRSVSAKLDHTLGGFESFKPRAFANVYYVPDTSTFRSDVNISILGKGKSSYHFGLDNVTNDPVINAQLGREVFVPGLRARYGFYRGKLGLGADYRLWEDARVRADWYNPANPKLNGQFAYRTPFGLTGLVGVEDVFGDFDWTLGFQLGKDLD